MRNLAAALVIALATALGIAGPAAAVQTSSAKVVIIVGATHGATAGYRTNADAAYNEAIKYTPRVTKVYSPDATWAKVKAAVAGANIVIYFGHGNGWPSPYTYDPAYATKDGFGLNADLNGDGKLSDYENKYYGEPYMAQLALAPNAIVMLHNLCYASGNNESGVTPEPTVSVARQRIDNYAAGFLKGGARAVLADGHMGPASYLRSFFTTGQSIVDAWRSAPNYHGHESAFASTRSAGYTDYSDPDGAASGYYRSLVVKPGLTTTAITNAVGDTGLDPASLVVPGRASVETPDASLSATSPTAALAGEGDLVALPQGTRLRTLATAAPATSTSPAVIQVQGLDDPSITGFVSAAVLAPRDSRAPVLIGLDSGLGRLSPNGDGRFDDQTVTGIFSEVVDWTVVIKAGDGTVLDRTTGHGLTFTITWDGLVDGVAASDGTYSWAARGVDAWQNGVATGAGAVVIDTVGVDAGAISPDGSTVSIFSPNGDGIGDVSPTTVSVPEAGSIAVRVTNAANSVVRSFSVASSTGANVVTWDGRATGGGYVPDGDYTLHFEARDRTGNGGVARSRVVRAIGFLSAVRSSTRVFYPQDNDRLAPTTTLSFTLSRPATVSWTVRNAANTIVATHLASAAVGAGTQTWAWNGRSNAGALLPTGSYAVHVGATDGTNYISQTVKFEMNAFAVTTSVSTARRGGLVSVTVTSAEPLSSGVLMYVTQPGVTTWHVTLTKIDSRTSRATIRVKTGGSAGTLKLTIKGRDVDGRTQSTIRSMPLS